MGSCARQRFQERAAPRRQAGGTSQDGAGYDPNERMIRTVIYSAICVRGCQRLGGTVRQSGSSSAGHQVDLASLQDSRQDVMRVLAYPPCPTSAFAGLEPAMRDSSKHCCSSGGVHGIRPCKHNMDLVCSRGRLNSTTWPLTWHLVLLTACLSAREAHPPTASTHQHNGVGLVRQPAAQRVRVLPR